MKPGSQTNFGLLRPLQVDFHLELRRPFGFGTLSCPISRRKGDAPKSKARLHKIDAYLCFLCLMGAVIDDPTSDLFSRSRIAKSEQLSDRNLRPRGIIAPCAFTVTVRVSSEMDLLSDPSARTVTETFTMTRWLRR